MSSLVSFSPHSGSTVVYSPFHRLMTAAIADAQEDAQSALLWDEHSGTKQALHDRCIAQMMRFADFPEVPAAIMLEVCELTATSPSYVDLAPSCCIRI